MNEEDIELNWDKDNFNKGSATGCGKTIDTNPRLKIAYLSKIWKENNFSI